MEWSAMGKLRCIACAMNMTSNEKGEGYRSR